MKRKISRKAALEYHSKGRKGKLEVVPSKSVKTQRDLALAYSPGVAEPCISIHRDPGRAYDYTAKGNLVGVISNGSACLGLGNIGPLACKPVMEGKGNLFKRFADIDVFDLEIDESDPDKFIQVVKALEPTFGGINLEDIKAPECFYIEEQLKEQMNIPVFHDDQHGTAIIATAALVNALEIAGKKIRKIKMVFNGAGAASIACANLCMHLGLRRKNIIMCDSKGVIYKGRTEGMNKYKEAFAVDTKARSLKDAVKDADVFFGLSVKDVVTKSMLRSMNKKPIVFAMANPDPEIDYPDAMAARNDVIMATGRSDYPNQVNNVLGFPFIFRGALDVRATQINHHMQLAAVNALAELARQDVPDYVERVYGNINLKFGRDYIIPKPFDPRVLLWVAPAVAKAAMDSGVAQKPIDDLTIYREQVERSLGSSREFMRGVFNQAKKDKKRIIFPEGHHPRVLKACQMIIEEGIAQPILIGSEQKICNTIEEMELDLDGIEIIQPSKDKRIKQYAKELYQLRQRKGMTQNTANERILEPNIFGTMMVKMGDADGIISGLTHPYSKMIRPALQIIRTRDGIRKVAGLYILLWKQRILFFADTTVNIDPSAEDLADIAILSAETVKNLGFEPKVAMISYSNFGSTPHSSTEKVAKAVELVQSKRPEIIIDGEMQADTAVTPEISAENFPFNRIKDGANVLIFPNLDAGNAAYKLMSRVGGATAIGPILMGMKKAINVLHRTSSAEDILNICALTVLKAQRAEKDHSA